VHLLKRRLIYFSVSHVIQVSPCFASWQNPPLRYYDKIAHYTDFDFDRDDFASQGGLYPTFRYRDERISDVALVTDYHSCEKAYFSAMSLSYPCTRLFETTLSHLVHRIFWCFSRQYPDHFLRGCSACLFDGFFGIICGMRSDNDIVQGK